MEMESDVIVSKFKRICMFWGSSHRKKISYQDAAIELGKELVSRNIDLVYGGGGYGTLEELLEVINRAELGIHDKSVGMVNVDGYYNSLLSFIDKVMEEGFISSNARQIIVSAPTAREIVEKLEEQDNKIFQDRDLVKRLPTYLTDEKSVYSSSLLYRVLTIVLLLDEIESRLKEGVKEIGSGHWNNWAGNLANYPTLDKRWLTDVPLIASSEILDANDILDASVFYLMCQQILNVDDTSTPAYVISHVNRYWMLMISSTPEYGISHVNSYICVSKKLNGKSINQLLINSKLTLTTSTKISITLDLDGLLLPEVCTVEQMLLVALFDLIMEGSCNGKKISNKDVTIELGIELVSRNIDFVYGSSSIGLMDLVSQAVHDGGRHVIGVIPRALMPIELTGETIGEAKVLADMHQRKAKIARYSNAFIAFPGRYGTLEELLKVINREELRIHDKPVGMLNVDGYYNSL
ncbi:Cytokinin riboside 5'-monophosphate phosphoribohydrolase LOG4 [Capsicum chinense]|nr:Cytokinin riboside 5'-monophosphate phosphoribohydrolase LOG4 [Capsicum chinense]